jgi:hypothetical protein
LEVLDFVKAYCVVGYNEAFKAYRIYIPVQWKTMMGKDVKFDEDMRSSSSHDISMIEGSDKVVIPKPNSKVRDESNSGVDEVRSGMGMPSLTTLARRKPRWLTQTLHNEQEHVGAPRSSMRAPRRYVTHIALPSSISESSNSLEEVRCDALMEECDGRLSVPFQVPVIDSMIATSTDLQMPGLDELQKGAQ